MGLKVRSGSTWVEIIGSSPIFNPNLKILKDFVLREFVQVGGPRSSRDGNLSNLG